MNLYFCSSTFILNKTMLLKKNCFIVVTIFDCYISWFVGSLCLHENDDSVDLHFSSGGGAFQSSRSSDFVKGNVKTLFFYPFRLLTVSSLNRD